MNKDLDPIRLLHRLILHNFLFLKFHEGQEIPPNILKAMDPVTKKQLIDCAQAMAEEFHHEPEKRAFLLDLGKEVH